MLVPRRGGRRSRIGLPSRSRKPRRRGGLARRRRAARDARDGWRRLRSDMISNAKCPERSAAPAAVGSRAPRGVLRRAAGIGDRIDDQRGVDDHRRGSPSRSARAACAASTASSTASLCRGYGHGHAAGEPSVPERPAVAGTRPAHAPRHADNSAVDAPSSAAAARIRSRSSGATSRIKTSDMHPYYQLLIA